MNLACVLLNNPVGNGQSKAGAAPLAWSGRGLCREKGIVNAFQMFRCYPGASVCNYRFNVTIGQRADAQSTASRHGFLRVQKEIEKYLLQLSGITVNRRQIIG